MEPDSVEAWLGLIGVVVEAVMTVAKMNPDQEAAYALRYGSSRSSLSPEAQIVYDRLVCVIFGLGDVRRSYRR